jgi:hypothetical protein
MNNSDYLSISNNQIIEEFKGGMGAVAGGDSFGAGAFGGSRGSSSRSPSSISQGGSRKYGSSGYASVSPITGSMSGLANRQPGSISGLGVVKPGAKTGTYTGGSFGGDGRYVVGFPGIKPGSNLPASSEPSLYIKPKPIDVKPRFFDGQTVQDVTLPYGKIEKHITPGIPGPRIGNKYDNVNKNRATKLRGPKFPYGVDLRDKNLTGYYGYQGQGYWFNPWYWGNGPFYPITGQILDYPDIPYNYEDLMQKEVNADYMVNTIQNQLANQYMEEDVKKEARSEEESESKESENVEITDKKPNSKENFESNEQSCNRNNVLIILAVVLIIYILLTMIDTNDKKS